MRWSLIATVALGACSGAPTGGEGAPPTLRMGGSDSFTRNLARSLATTHAEQRSTMRFEITGGGDTEGIKRLLAGDLDIAASSREPRPTEEEQARANGYSLLAAESRHVIGVDVIAVAVHPQNPLDHLTYDQVIGMFCTREIDNWSFLGLEDAPIRAITSEPNSGTRVLFEDFFCGPRGIHPKVEVLASEPMRAALASDKAAITFASLSERAGKPLGLRPDPTGPAVHASQQNILRGSYPLYNDLTLITAGPPRGEAKQFIEFVLSPAGQEVVDEERFVPLFLRPERMDEARPLRETIHFEQDETQPNLRSAARLQLLVDELRDRAGEYKHVVLEGYTDNREAASENLSYKRAEAVRDMLQAELPGLYFEIIPRGSVNPIAPNDTPYGRQRNRRVQIYLAAEEKGDDGEGTKQP